MSDGPDLLSPPRRRFGAVMLVFTLSLAVRALFLWDVRVDPTYEHLVHDEGVNDQIARAILAGQMPPVSYYKAPLYMYLLAGAYGVLGEEPMRARWAQLVIDSLSPVLILLIARRLFGTLVGTIAGLLAAVFWTFVFYSAELVDTSLACLLYLLLAYLAVALPEGRWYKWPACGAVLGLGAITRPNILAFAPVLAVTVLIVNWLRIRRDAASARPNALPNSLRTLGKPALMVVGLTLGCLATILPVTLRNWFVAGQRTLIATYGGLNFYVANSPWSDGKHGPLIVEDGVPDISAIDLGNLWSRLDLNYNVATTYAQKHTGRSMTMQEVDAYFYDLTRDHVRAHPGKFIRDSFKRLCWLFNRYEFPNVKDLYRLTGVSDVLAGLSWLHYGLLCPIALLGIFLAVATHHRAPGMAYYAAMLGSLSIPGAFFVMNSRYRLPTVYLLVPFAAYGAVRFLGLWRHTTSWSLRLTSCAVLLAAALLSNLNLFGYANAHHTELRMTYAQACRQTGRADLLRHAAERFDSAYRDELEHGGLPWANTLHHAAPMTWLFLMYRDLWEADADPDDLGEALRCGRLMMQREPFNAPVFLALFELLVKYDRRDDAREMLRLLERHMLSVAPEITVECFIKYWRSFSEPSVLLRTEKLLTSLSSEKPGETYFRVTLDKVRKLLEATQAATRTSTGPSTLGEPR
ncbi:MAG: glycosyltransferase family 39 protein [Phycisphaerae bacterium]|nr:glycosyltransferase family 39 protein [Phycisphaerae bacterium]